MLNEETLRSKGDLSDLSESTKVLKIGCGLEKEDAVNIMKRCRTLEEVVFESRAFTHTERDALEYLNRWVYLEKE